MVEEEGFTPVSPIKNPGLVALTVLETAEELLLARAYTVPVPREIVKVVPVCQLSGVVSPTSQAYCKVPPPPVADKATVAVVFPEAGLLNVTLEVVGAETLACPSSHVISLSALLPPLKGVELCDQIQ